MKLLDHMVIYMVNLLLVSIAASLVGLWKVYSGCRVETLSKQLIVLANRFMEGSYGFVEKELTFLNLGYVSRRL